MFFCRYKSPPHSWKEGPGLKQGVQECPDKMWGKVHGVLLARLGERAMGIFSSVLLNSAVSKQRAVDQEHGIKEVYQFPVMKTSTYLSRMVVNRF